MLKKSSCSSGFLSMFLFGTFVVSSLASAEVQPGDVFKEFIYSKRIQVNQGWRRYIERDSATVTLSVDDLKNAIHAEVAVNFGTGHIGTSDQSIRINQGQKRALPQPDTPGNSYCYFRKIHGRPALAIPLSELKQGDNKITFFVDQQVCYGFKWPGYNVESVLVRVFYHATKPHPTGSIVSPKSGEKIGDKVSVEAIAKPSKSPIVSVDLIGFYEGYPFEGSGRFTDWHYGVGETGSWDNLIASSFKAPHTMEWDLTWITDQREPMQLMARIRDASGMCYMTPAVQNLQLDRKERSVKLYRAYDVPENFKVRLSATVKCPLEPISENLCRATAAQLASITFIGHLEGKFNSTLGLNGLKLYSYTKLSDYEHPFFYPSMIPVPLGLLQNGINEFSIFNSTQGHMSEVSWPGPALLVEYDLTKSVEAVCDGRPTYPPYTGPRFDTEYFRYTASDSVVFFGEERAHLLLAKKPGDFLEFIIHIPRPGAYDFYVDYLRGNDHGICRLYIEDKPHGSEWDQFIRIDGPYKVPEEIKTEVVTFDSAGEKSVRLEITGKNPDSKGYRLAVSSFFIKRARLPGQ